MPGMMDTILNLGLNDQTVEALAEQANDRRFAFDSYRRFVQMYGNVVLDIPGERFERLLDRKKQANGVESDSELGAEALAELGRRVQADRHGSKPASRSRTILRSSSGGRSRRCSNPGTTPAQSPTAA